MKKIIQAYNAATTYVDDLIGKILDHIDNNTIVVITGDHGNIIFLYINLKFCDDLGKI